MIERETKKYESIFPEKTKDSSCGSGAVFGVPLSCCVETTSRKRSSQLESSPLHHHDDGSSPTAKASRSDSRTSIASVRDRVRPDTEYCCCCC